TTTTTTTTTLPKVVNVPIITTTTTTVPKPIFKPIIQNSRSCSQAGGGSYSLSIDNTSSTVDMTIKIKIIVDRVKVLAGTYSVSAGQSFNLTTISGAPEDSLYRIRFIVRDSLSGVKSKGGFKKITDCVDDSLGSPNKILGVIQTTTTTIPQNDNTNPTDAEEPINPPEENTTNLSTIEPIEEESISFCEDMTFDSSDECSGPISSDEGNDAFIWDEYDEGIYLTDGNYEVKYFYEEEKVLLAATGINTDLYVLISTIFSIAGVLLFTTGRKRKLISQPKNVDLVFKNAFKLKNRLEKTFNQIVSINIDFNKINPYGIHFGSVGLHKESVARVNKELIEAYESLKIIALNDKTRDLNNLQNEFESNLEELSSDLFKVVFTNKPLEEKKVTTETKVGFFESFKFRFSKSLSMGFGIIFLVFGLYTAGYLTQQIYLSNNQQIQAQMLLQELYQKNAKEINSNLDKEAQINFTDNLVQPFSNDVPTLITENNLTDKEVNILSEFFNSLTGNNSNESEIYQPDVFGYLEIPKIN
ncbi:hypothetical protein EB151_10685, partial [archaeon]|nr:hypothetical protein [archaeon]